MSSWVSAWINGRNDGDEETKQNADATNTPAVVPDADEIRRKRLERLHQLEAQQQQQQPQPVSSVDPVIAAGDTSSTSLPSTKVSRVDPPVNAVPMQSVVSNAAQERVLSTPQPTSAPKRAAPRPYLNDALERVLLITLGSSPSEQYLRLPQLADAVGTTTLTEGNVSEVLYSRLVMDPVQLSGSSHPLAVVQYLEQCYYRCNEELCKLDSSYLRIDAKEKDTAVGSLQSLREMCVNYSVTALTEPEMFPYEVGTLNTDALEKMARSLVRGSSEFIDLVALELDKSESAFAVFAPIFQKFLSELFMINPPSLMSNFSENMIVISVLVRNKVLAKVFTAIPGFLLLHGAPFTGRRLQDATALGLLHRFSTAQDPAIQQLFSNITKRTKVDVENSIRSIRMKLNAVQMACCDIVKSLLKAGGTSRDQVLLWLEQAMQVNAERAKENPDMSVASTSGMMLNLTMVLLRLCDPFLGIDSKKSDLINPSFLATQNAIFPSDVTYLVGRVEDASSSDSRGTPGSGSDFNFITRCYFVTVRAMHLGPVAAINQYMRLLRQLSFFQSRMSDNSDPRMRAHFEALAASKMVQDAEILHPDLVNEMVRFVLLSSKVVRKICCNSEPLSLPLSEESAKQNSLLKYVPEHMVEDICTVLIFLARIQPESLNAFAFSDLLQMMMTFLSSPAYVRSPHLRAKMSEVLFFIFLPSEETDERQTAGTMSGVNALTYDTLAQRHLAPCLLALYGDVEQTGFYEKLEHRYNIACLLKFLWKLPGHKSAFVRISEERDNFVKFAHGLMNHINSLVTDALISLPEIRNLQEEMSNVERWMALEESVREQKQSLLSEKERIVTSSLQLANETIHMMSYLTTEIREPFIKMPELEERLVSMLNSVLVKLAGPRGIELKVTNPEQYKFRPKQMLREIVETLLHFASYASFQHAVATNGFYDGPVFSKCVTILRRTQLLPPAEITEFERFVNEIQRVAEEAASAEASLGEVPDEFLDPLVFTLMKDPVKLPTSGYIMDRATITQHLLNDATDPFTRAPLKPEDLVPDVELKRRIQEWISAHSK